MRRRIAGALVAVWCAAALLIPVPAASDQPYVSQPVPQAAFRPVGPVDTIIGPIRTLAPRPGRSILAPPLPTATAAATEAPTPRPSPKPTNHPPQAPIPAPRPPVAHTGASGVASWYCLPGVSPCTAGFAADGMYAAAGPALRVGNWRGRTVLICNAGQTCVSVVLIDTCQCLGYRLVDLYAGVYRKLAGGSRGLGTVTVTW